MLKKYTTLALIVLTSIVGHAQNNFCGVTESNKDNNKAKSFHNQKESFLNNELAQLISQQGINPVSNAVAIEVPIVFHIIHLGGPENLPDSMIYTELANLNHRFANTGGYNFPDGVNVNIQFCLASIDPYGNPTNGITRTYSPLANMPPGGDVLVKNLSRWNPYRYLNVWLVKDCFTAMGHSAYSNYPWNAHGLEDGIVIQSSSFGAAFTYFLLSHEAGHYFGLYHNNEGDSCVNFNCLLDGDRVCDTPPEFEPALCNGNTCTTDMDDTSGVNPFAADMNDISNLMMPIIGCPYLFTQGQATRMNYFLNTARNTLLTSNGCGQHPSGNPLPMADIGSITNVCNGYQFVSGTQNAEYIEWDFNGDGLTDAVGDTVNYLFPAQGNYTIVLRAFNEVGFDADTFNLQVYSVNNTIFPLSTYTGVSNNGAFACFGSNLTLTAVPGMVHYQWSTGDTTQTIVIPVTGPISVTLTCTDSAGMVWQKCPDPVFSWGVAPAPAPFTISLLTDDTLCTNQPFAAQFTPQAGTYAQLITDGYPTLMNGNIGLNYYNQSEVYISVVLRNSSNYCPTYTDTIHVLFTTPVDSVQVPVVNGNYISVGDTVEHVQWYLDGIPVLGATFDTEFLGAIGCYTYAAWNSDPDCAVMSSEYCNAVVGLENRQGKQKSTVYPNPNHGLFSVYFQPGGVKNYDITLTDLAGRNILFDSLVLNANHVQIKTESIAPGIYILKLLNESQLIIIQ